VSNVQCLLFSALKIPKSNNDDLAQTQSIVLHPTTTTVDTLHTQ